MMNLSIESVVSACGGRFLGEDSCLAQPISCVSTDSRKLEPGCLFAAIAGERVDGHDYIAAALEGGAACVLAERVPRGVDGNIILVESTIAALQYIAAFYRSGFDIPVIGISGSVGKTTAKEMISSVLGRRFKVHKTAGNFNNDLGVPLTLFGLEREHEVAVIEMGISHFGDMARLGRMVRPTAAVFTVIGHAHLEYLGSRQGVLREKAVMLEYLQQDGLVICNGDDDLLNAMSCTQRKLSFGLGEGCGVRAEDIRLLEGGGTACRIVGDGRSIEVEIPAYGEHMIYAALEGAAVGIAFGLSDEEIAAGIAEYEPVGHRARVLKSSRLTVIDDCYNANPTSTASAIRSLSVLQGRKLCILGDMLELGEKSDELHRETGELALKSGIDMVLSCGAAAEHISRGAAGISRHFASMDELMDALPGLVKSGDVILVKASRSMKFEEIVEKLMEI